MLQFESFVFNPFAENTYVVYDDNAKECVIIDPGCSNASEENELFGFIDSHRLKPLMVVNTHGHIDHILGNAAVKKRYGIEVAAHPNVKNDFLRSRQQAAMFGLSFDGECDLPDRDLEDGEDQYEQAHDHQHDGDEVDDGEGEDGNGREVELEEDHQRAEG